MDTRRKLECLKRAYPKDFTLCDNFLNRTDYQSVNEILNSIRQMEVNDSRMNEEEKNCLIELSSYVQDVVMEMSSDWFEGTDEPPDDLFLNDLDDEQYE